MRTKVMDKNALLSLLENTVEKQLQEVVHVFQNLNEEILLQPPAQGGWSIAQCLEHLNSYGDYYLPAMEKGLGDFHGNPSNTFKSSWLGARFVKMMDPSRGNKKYKAFKDHVPAKDLSAHAVVAEHFRQQEVLLKLIRNSKEKDLNKIRIPISISKWIKLKLGDVFQFVVVHNERHLLQAKRNLGEDLLKGYFLKE